MMSSINGSQNPQPVDPHRRPALIRQPANRGLLGDRKIHVVSLDSLRPGEPLNSTVRRTSEVVQDQFFSNTLEGGGGGGGKATLPSSLTRSAVRLSQSSSTTFIQDPSDFDSDGLDTDGLDTDGLDTDSEDESKAGSPKPRGNNDASKPLDEIWPEIETAKHEYTHSYFASRGFDDEFQKEMKAALTDFYQSTDPKKTVSSQGQAASDAQSEFENTLLKILDIDWDPIKKVEELDYGKALKLEALNLVNTQILLFLQSELQGTRDDDLSPIIRKILIQCGYAVVGEEGVYLKPAKPQEFLNFSEALKETQKQLDICLNLFEQVKGELSRRGCSEEGIQSRLSDFIKGFEFTRRKSIFNQSETKEFIKQILALDLHRREEAKEEARATLISKGMNPKVIDYGIKQLFLTRYKNIFVPALSGSDLASKVESFIKKEYAKLVDPLFQQFDPKYYSLDVVKSFINRLMEAHIEETSLILEEKGINGLREFVETKVQRDLVVIAHFYKDAQKILVEELTRAGWKKEVVNSFFNKVFEANLDEAKLDQAKLEEMETILKNRRIGGSELEDFVNRTIKPNVESLLKGIPKKYSHTEIFSEIVKYLAQNFEKEGWNYKAALSTINVVFEEHMEEIWPILSKGSKKDLDNFVRMKVIPEVRSILQNVPKYLTLRAMTLAREYEKEGWDYKVALEIVESVMNDAFMSIKLKATIQRDGSAGLDSIMNSEVKPQVMRRLRKIPKVSPPDKKPKI